LDEVVDGVTDGEIGDDLGITPQSFDFDLEAGVARSQHGQPPGLVVVDPVLPASGGHP
jgi:hypothetical protein